MNAAVISAVTVISSAKSMRCAKNGDATMVQVAQQSDGWYRLNMTIDCRAAEEINIADFAEYIRAYKKIQ